ncbi:MAG TPA: FAD-binding oxidoreductase [Streptosporangiaceae bacterium]|nr:FAD-binding oxidoreductase [Streptosporangiaceae bacterium]
MTTDSIPGPLAQACDEVRLAGPADAVAGVQPGLVAAPASTEQASAVLRAAAQLGLTVVPRGSGTKLDWGYPPDRADLIIDTTRLNQVVEHEAGDLVATVQAGVTIEQLAAVLAKAGQRLALDLPARRLPSGATRSAGTIGGVLSTNVAGPLRFRYGSPRDLLIGLTIVRADGTIAKSGGKVVKNVAGYDLGKLLAGSRGTLGLITQATFRLHPLPAATGYVTVPCATPGDCARLLAVAQSAAIAPVAAELDWTGPDEPIMLGVAIEGDPAGVAQRSETLADQLAREAGGTAVAMSDAPPAWWGSRAAATPDDTVLQVASWAGRVGTVLAQLRAAAARTGLDLVIGGSAAAGLLDVAIPSSADPGQIASFVTSLRAAWLQGQSILDSPISDNPLSDYPKLDNPISGHGRGGVSRGGGVPPRATVVVLRAPASVREQVDLFGPVPSLGLMRAVKQQFDPGRTLSPGRFAGGI